MLKHGPGAPKQAPRMRKKDMKSITNELKVRAVVGASGALLCTTIMVIASFGGFA
jgi:hypothetical protein